MLCTSCGPGIVGKVVSLTLLGVGVLFIGPILIGVVATVLPFALVGALAYFPYRILMGALGYARPLQFRPFRASVVAARPPVPDERPIVREQPVNLQAITPPARSRWTYVAGRVVAEMGCGALLGGLLGGLAGQNDPALGQFLALGAGIGTVVGFVVGGTRLAPPRNYVA